jgi:hypothetical protein
MEDGGPGRMEACMEQGDGAAQRNSVATRKGASTSHGDAAVSEEGGA